MKGYRVSEGGWAHAPRLTCDTFCRPVVVIDPEDTGQVDRLLTLIQAADHPLTCNRDCNMDTLTDALREFADPTPPKPAEPLGLGAVVEDTGGVLWIRSGHSLALPCWRRSGGDKWTGYDDINVARVLSEGVASRA